MAFCNSCGASLTPDTKFCNKCGAAVAAPPASATPVTAPPVSAPPAKGGSSALKIILIVVAVLVFIAILAMVTCGMVIHRAIKHAKVSQNGDNVKIETPFGTVGNSKDPEQAAKDLGIEIYPGAQVEKNGASSVTFGSVHSITAMFESSDSVDKVCSFYKSKFPNAMATTSDQNHCTIVSNDQKAMITINIDPDGSGSKFQITNVTKKTSSE
ncbi:MAG TPA: zinc ribbon domain-containing protein [Candidatus Sulfotelmatobacter sp.]|nr:zinc ribbon domain-containing protein [Candidatus Sulfotelmatobacter sp.]